VARHAAFGIERDALGTQLFVLACRAAVVSQFE
jgi:hypothetical protein